MDVEPAPAGTLHIRSKTQIDFVGSSPSASSCRCLGSRLFEALLFTFRWLHIKWILNEILGALQNAEG